MAEKFTFKTHAVSRMPHPPHVPKIRFKGVWDMQDLYEFMINYFRERKYKFHERVYKHKHPSPYGVERQYCWRAERMRDDVYSFVIDIYIHTYDAHDITVKDRKGNVKTFTKGRIWIEFLSNVEVFEDERWTGNSFWASVRAFLNSYVLRKKHGWEIWDVQLYREVHKLVWLIRRRLKMEHDDFEQKDWMGVHT